MRRQSGFTLVELLVVVLIIGILATIAIPVFNGQRAKAKDSAAVAALRNGVLAARSYYIGNQESFANMDAADLKSNENSLYRSNPAEPFGAAITPSASADPTRIAIAGTTFSATLSSAADTATDNPGANAQVAVLCSVSNGDGIFCGKMDLGAGGQLTWRYYSARSLGNTLALNDSNGTAAGAPPIAASQITGSTF